MTNVLRNTTVYVTKALALSSFGILLTPIAIAATSLAEFNAAPEANATFEAVGKPSLLKIKGHGAKVTGQLLLSEGDARGKFEVDLNQFDTGIELRNRHMKEKYLETEKFPKTTLEIDHVDLPKDWKPGADISSAKFQGKLTLKGTTKPVEGTVKISGTNMAAEADFVIDISQFPIGVPSYMGVTVASSVNVHVAIPAFVRK